MAGVEALAIISVLAPLLKVSVDCIKRISAQRKKKKADKNFLAEELEKSLGEGEWEIRSAYEMHIRKLAVYRLDDCFRRGDDISNHAIYAQILEAKSIKRILELALHYKRDIEDIRTAHKSSIGIPRDTQRTMDELTVRIMQANPMLGPQMSDPRLSTASSSNTTAVVDSAESALPNSSSSRSPISPILSEPHVQSRAPEQRTHPGMPHPRLNSEASFNSTGTSESSGSEFATPAAMARRTVSGGFIAGNGPRTAIFGAANRKNKYHGFCGGAWASQQDIKDGMRAGPHWHGNNGPRWYGGPAPQQNGHTNHPQIFKCKDCLFKAPAAGPDRTPFLDPAVRTAACGIQYRVSFLAKSHRKCEDFRVVGGRIDEFMADQKYGCVFCCAEGWLTTTFGGIESLMNHISYEHGKSMGPDIQRRMNCIWGKFAASSDPFDINIPPVSSPTPDEVATPDSLESSKELEQILVENLPLKPPALFTVTSVELPAFGDYQPFVGSNAPWSADTVGRYRQ